MPTLTYLIPHLIPHFCYRRLYFVSRKKEQPMNSPHKGDKCKKGRPDFNPIPSQQLIAADVLLLMWENWCLATDPI